MSTASFLRLSSALRKPAMRPVDADRIGIGHALVDNCSFEEACSAIVSHAIARGKPAYVITPNAQHIVLLEKEVRLREIYQKADLVVPDGVSLLYAARTFGRTIRERVAGVDLFQSLCALSAEHNLRVFLLGGRPGSANRCAAELKKKFPNLHVDTYCPPFGFENNKEEHERTNDAIRSAKPDLLFVGLGAPKQEYWIFDHGRRLGASVCVGVGGTFEMVGGIVRRSPVWIQDLGFEWLYRLCAEPRRMWRRYLIGNVQFCSIVARQRIRRTFLNVLVSLLHKGAFAAELEEPNVGQETRHLTSRLLSFASAVKHQEALSRGSAARATAPCEITPEHTLKQTYTIHSRI